MVYIATEVSAVIMNIINVRVVRVVKHIETLQEILDGERERMGRER